MFPATPTLQHDFTIQLGPSTITPSASVRNLGVIFDDQLTFKEHIAKTARSCRFVLHNIWKISPSSHTHTHTRTHACVTLCNLELNMMAGPYLDLDSNTAGGRQTDRAICKKIRAVFMHVYEPYLLVASLTWLRFLPVSAAWREFLN